MRNYPVTPALAKPPIYLAGYLVTKGSAKGEEGYKTPETKARGRMALRPFLQDRTYPRVLESYHYLKPAFLEHWPKSEPIFLDSGAFSAMSKGAEIKLPEYIEFIRTYREHFAPVAALDVIGNPDASFANWLRMRDAGVDCFPTFHFGSPTKALEAILKEDPPFMAFGGMVGRTPAELRKWLDEVWPLVVDGKGRPLLKVHGFGLTSLPLLMAYPWGSADSSSWIKISRFGSALLDIRGRLVLVCFSEQSPAAFDLTSSFLSFWRASPEEQELVRETLDGMTVANEFLAEIGEEPLTPEALSKRYSYRDIACVVTYSQSLGPRVPKALTSKPKVKDLFA